MINNIIRSLIYFVMLVLVQVLVLNNIQFLRMATPFLYLYFILKLPFGISRSQLIFASFLIGIVIDAFSNTPGMHAASCTLVGFLCDPFIRFFIGKELTDGTFPSYRVFGFAGFLRYTLTIVLIHHTTLFLIESFTLFDPLFLILRIFASAVTTTLLICIVEAFNMEPQKSGD
ncbi:rod shape-determining protein MreD [Parabacteroides sp. PF5-9]|uniref:rod shape-determining protein MreD n=1 Tax=Parabacteroides sp. PF5-9 TaxID=1742404 RepID=UPI0024765BB6|nr:rod shape-determining protein MreD [Parabacteroides sp. PF5-9]MDH6358276.1 rod shape-determining protein MreD [Parabacteroides sp. PF5-9]